MGTARKGARAPVIDRELIERELTEQIPLNINFDRSTLDELVSLMVKFRTSRLSTLELRRREQLLENLGMTPASRERIAAARRRQDDLADVYEDASNEPE